MKLDNTCHRLLSKADFDLLNQDNLGTKSNKSIFHIFSLFVQKGIFKSFVKCLLKIHRNKKLTSLINT